MSVRMHQHWERMSFGAVFWAEQRDLQSDTRLKEWRNEKEAEGGQLYPMNR